MQVHCRGHLGGRKIVCCPPDVARRTGLAHRTHHIIANRGIALGAVVFAFEEVVEPTNHMIMDRPVCVGGVGQVANAIAFVVLPMQPGANQQLLLPA